jgi:hypothetical protein
MDVVPEDVVMFMDIDPGVVAKRMETKLHDTVR